MKKADVIAKIFHGALKTVPDRDQGLAFAPTNIALCKYWGKRDPELNLPVTSSLSVALPDKGSLTAVRIIDEDQDRILLNDELIDAETLFAKRTVAFLDLFRPEKKWHLSIDIKMNVPLSAGLASSACGFASLVSALNDLFNWQLSHRYLSILARIGSGSASRSLWSGFVEWHAGVQADGMDSYSEPLPFEWPELYIGLLPVSYEAKAFSSSEAMQTTVNTSMLYANWPRKALQDLIIIKQALHKKNFALLGGTAESNALAMHATILSSWPPICYFLPETVAYMHEIWALRKQGLSLFFTEDAGPNLKLLFLEKDRADIQNLFSSLEIIRLFES